MKKWRAVVIVTLLQLMFQVFLYNGYAHEQNQIIVLPVQSLRYSQKDSKTFAAQVFNYPCTQVNFNAYFSDFKEYHMTRVIIPGFSSDITQDQKAYQEHLQKNQKTFEMMWEKNNALILSVGKMPKWLSDSQDSTTFEFDKAWRIYNAHQPKDYNAWKILIKTVATFYKSIKPKDKTIYYEVWNEPDLDYWLDTTDDYLKLFQSTMEAIKEVDPDAKVGGPAVCNYYGRIDSMRQPVISELLSYSKKKNFAIDFVSFHGFTYAFVETFSDADTYIRTLLKNLEYPASPEILVSEWNSPKDIRGSKSSCAAMMNGYYAFWKLGIEHHTWAAWEDFQQNATDDYGLLSREKGDAKKGIERPVYWGFYYMDWLQTDSMGTTAFEHPTGLKFVLSKGSKSNEYRCIMWNFVNHPDIRAILYISKAIPSEELVRDYKDSNEIRYYIHLGKSKNGKRDKEFKEAKRLYKMDLNSQDTINEFNIVIPGSKRIIVSEMKSIRSSLQNKDCSIKGNLMDIKIQNNEVVVFTITLH